MASLLDRIQQVGQQGVQPSQAGIEKIVRERGGKAKATTGPAATGLAEQAAITAGKQALQEQSFAERLQAAQLRGQEQAAGEELALGQQKLAQQRQMTEQQMAAQAAGRREELAAGEEEARQRLQAGEARNIQAINAKAEQSLRDLAASRNIALDDIFSQFEASALELEDRRDAAQLEQLAFQMAMQDKAYLQELENVGRTRQLQNDLAMEEEMLRLTFGSNMASMLSEREFQAGYNADQRQFSKDLAQINIDMAIDLAKAATRDEQLRQQYQAIGTAGAETIKFLAKDKDGQ